jgi:hypothetical protein
MHIHDIFSHSRIGLRQTSSPVEGSGRPSDAASPELVQRVSERLKAGDYLTPAAARLTAQAIADHPDI